MPINPDYIFFICELGSLCQILFVSRWAPSPSQSLFSETTLLFQDCNWTLQLVALCVHHIIVWQPLWVRLKDQTGSKDRIRRAAGSKWGEIYRGNYLTKEHFIIKDLWCNDFCPSQCTLTYRCVCVCICVCLWWVWMHDVCADIFFTATFSVIAKKKKKTVKTTDYKLF